MRCRTRAANVLLGTVFILALLRRYYWEVWFEKHQQAKAPKFLSQLFGLILFIIAVFIALTGTTLDTASKAFMSWFGPKGVATMAFSLLVLSRQIEAGQRIFDIAALAVFASIVVHGLSDTPGTNWIARRGSAAEQVVHD